MEVSDQGIFTLIKYILPLKNKKTLSPETDFKGF